MSEINFKSSARQGDIIEIGIDVVKFGTSSLTLKCEVRNMMTRETIITIEKYNYGKPWSRRQTNCTW
jgi:acyl-CoA hydrolase